MEAESIHLLCAGCGDRIGVYEPYARFTAAGEPVGPDDGDAWEPYHEQCAALLAGRGDPEP